MIEFISITADPVLARRLWALPSHTVMVDLEIAGKHERQSSRDTIINCHNIDDVSRLSQLPRRGPMLVRTNALEFGCISELKACLDLGIERFMFPMFRSRHEVDRLLGELRGRAAVSLLVETDSAVKGIESILRDLPVEVDHIHIGLNDLSLERKTPFLFLPVATKEIERLSEIVRSYGRRFGFGGIGAAGYGDLPGERLLGEHVRVESTVAILSRTFHSNLAVHEPAALELSVQELRAWEELFRKYTATDLESNWRWLEHRIGEILGSTHKPSEGTSA